MKKNFFLAIFCLTSISCFAQLKVHSNGRVLVGHGSPATPWADFHVNGGLLVYGAPTALTLVNGSWSSKIGSSSGLIHFEHSSSGWNEVRAMHYHLSSDSTLKQNIKPLDSNLAVIQKLKPYKYSFIQDSTNRLDFGFMAQQVERVLPSIVITGKESKAMNYDAIIPFLVGGMQEQQKIIETQDSMINILFEKLDAISNNFADDITKPAAFENNRTAKLYQNSPNPFTNETIIKFDLPTNFGEASIMIFNLSGVLINTIRINDRNENSVTVEGNELGAGMYLYTLIIDNEEIDTKKMILKN